MATPYTPQEYYDDQTLHGNYQYVTLADIINTFLVRYVGDNEEINNVARHRIIFEAKRGLKELNYDALKEVKAIEIELDDNLELTLPHDYVNYVRLSWVDDNGNFRPLIQNTDTGIVEAYLQDNEYNILFDDEGYPLSGTSTTDINQENAQSSGITNYSLYNGVYEHGQDYRFEQGGHYNLDTARANINGDFTISMREGKIRFSRDLPKRTVVLEYISDGLEHANESDIKVHKFAERALYAFIKYEILNNRFDSTEYKIRRAKNDWIRERQNAKIRISDFKPHQLIQRLKGRRKWVK